jgi:hypothetical protein
VEKDKRSPGGQGYTGFEAVLQYIFDQMQAINIYDENGHILKVDLSASECSDYQNADSVKRKEKQEPGFLSRCLAGLGPNQPGVTTADPSDTGVDDAGAPSPPSSSKKTKSKSKQDKDKSKNAPGQPDLKKALEKLLKGGGGGNKPSVPSLPNVKVPKVPLPNVQTPSVPGVTNGSGGQSTPPDPQALLDYLLSP